MEPRTAVFALIESGDLAGLKALLLTDPGVTGARNEAGDSPLLAALYHGRRDLADLLLQHGAGVGLFEACVLGYKEVVEGHLRSDPALVNAHSHDGWTPLHLASFFGHEEVVSLLLGRGADVNARSRSARFATSNTPLHAAAANRRTSVAEILIDHGADVNARDGSGFTPLALAANNKNDLLMIRLLEKGAQAT